MNFANNDLKVLFKNFFGDKLPDSAINNLNKNLYFWCVERFDEYRRITNKSRTLGFNNSSGSYLDMSVPLYHLLDNCIHESVHKVSNNENASGFRWRGAEVLRGINESCTEYFALQMYKMYAGDNAITPSTGYFLGVDAISSMIDAGIFNLDDLTTAYINSDVGYLQTSIESLGGDFNKIMEDFYLATEANDWVDRHAAKDRLDNAITKMVAFMTNN